MTRTSSDPRNALDFEAELFPLCDGEPFGLESAGEKGKEKLGCLVAFYFLNQASRNLKRHRANNGDPVGERELLRAVETALLAKEDWDDRLTSLGMCATPKLHHGLVTEVEFCEPGGRPGLPRVFTQSSSACLDLF